MIDIASPQLLTRLHQTAVAVPPPLLAVLARVLQQAGDLSYEQLRRTVFQHIPTPEFRDTINELLTAWQSEQPALAPPALALALASAAHSHQTTKAQTAIEIVWTGPTTGVLPLRRTEQVLLEMIREAVAELLIVSFAVYDIAEIVTALERAVARGVALTLVVETPASSQGKIPFGAAAVLSDSLKAKARLLEWPHEQREKDRHGKYGSLHAKCAVADRSSVLISSANLTQYALNLNMEMGLRVRDQALAEQIVRHFAVLEQQQILA